MISQPSALLWPKALSFSGAEISRLQSCNAELCFRQVGILLPWTLIGQEKKDAGSISVKQLHRHRRRRDAGAMPVKPARASTGDRKRPEPLTANFRVQFLDPDVLPSSSAVQLSKSL